jgi:phage-related protein
MQVIPTAVVASFLYKLDKDAAARVEKMIHSLEENGSGLRMPDSKSLRKGLFELRILGNSQIRILYFFDKDSTYLVHAFFKKTMKIPRREIKYGRMIMKKLLHEL